MVRIQTGIPTADSPPVTDDFTLIKGIGTAHSLRLHNAGIFTYHQLASLTPETLAEKVPGRSAKQIAFQDWIGQATKLASRQKKHKTHHKYAGKNVIRQHYENFTIEFLLDEKNNVRRTRAVHVQSGDADTWSGWEADQLIDFLARHTGTCPWGKKLKKKEGLPVPNPPSNNIPPESSSAIAKISEPVTRLLDITDASQAVSKSLSSDLQPPGNAGFAGTLRLKGLGISPIGSNAPARSLCQNQPCQARITIDLKTVVAPRDVPIQYKITITFKQLGGDSYLVCEENHFIERSDCVTQSLVCTTPPSGLYRPEAFVKLFSDKTALGLMASIKGELIQII